LELLKSGACQAGRYFLELLLKVSGHFHPTVGARFGGLEMIGRAHFDRVEMFRGGVRKIFSTLFRDTLESTRAAAVLFLTNTLEIFCPLRSLSGGHLDVVKC